MQGADGLGRLVNQASFRIKYGPASMWTPESCANLTQLFLRSEAGIEMPRQ